MPHQYAMDKLKRHTYTKNNAGTTSVHVNYLTRIYNSAISIT